MKLIFETDRILKLRMRHSAKIESSPLWDICGIINEIHSKHHQIIIIVSHIVSTISPINFLEYTRQIVAKANHKHRFG